MIRNRVANTLTFIFYHSERVFSTVGTYHQSHYIKIHENKSNDKIQDRLTLYKQLSKKVSLQNFAFYRTRKSKKILKNKYRTAIITTGNSISLNGTAAQKRDRNYIRLFILFYDYHKNT